MEKPKILGDSFLAMLHRHFINVMCSDYGDAAKSKHGGKHAIYNFSAFIVEISGEWYAITAGHIFDELKKAQSMGAKLSNWQIDDSILSSTPMPAYPIPVDLESDVLWLHDAVPGIDYAAMKINHLARSALQNQGICAIPPEIWAAEDVAEYSQWLLVGTPKCFAELAADAPIVKYHVTVALERLRDGEHTMEEKEYKRLHAKIDFSSIMEKGTPFDIGGMSGGPIFGIKPETTETPYEYRIIGVQSSRYGADNVAICAAPPFIEALSRIIAVKSAHESPSCMNTEHVSKLILTDLSSDAKTA
jgi:hypothetical protein